MAEPALEHLLETLSRPELRLAMVIGGADSGKTTLIERLARELCRGEAIWGLVDADIGQSHLGPPATVAWSRLDRNFSGWRSLEPQGIYFAGAVSPPGSLLPLLAGTGLMARAALGACDKVIVDTSGLIAPPLGPLLKHHKIDLLAPQLLLAIACGEELDPLLSPLLNQKLPLVLRLPAAPERRRRGAFERARYRQDRFQDYFAGAGRLRLPLDRIGLRFSRVRTEDLTASSGRLVSLRDGDNRDLALGIIEAEQDGELLVKTPWQEADAVTTVIVGMVELPTREVGGTNEAGQT